MIEKREIERERERLRVEESKEKEHERNLGGERNEEKGRRKRC